MSEFDILISSIILQFSHFTDWSINKPYLISQNFYNAFKSNEFIKSYIINLFKLNEKNLNHLEFLLNKKPFTTIINLEEQPKKKKKMNQKINISSFKDILKLYVQCYNEKNNRKSLVKFCRENQSFKNLNNTFVKSVTDKTDIEEITFCNKYIFFTKCAFPLIIKSNFDYSIDSYRSDYYKTEEITINSKRLFNHSFNGSGCNTSESRFYNDDETLNDLKTVLFRKDKLREYEEEEEVELELYEWLQLGLLKHCLNIQKQAEEEEINLTIFSSQILNEECEDEESD